MAIVKFGEYTIQDNTIAQMLNLVLRGHGEENAKLYSTINEIVTDGYKSVREIYYKKINPDLDYNDGPNQRLLLENYIRFAETEVNDTKGGYEFVFNVDEFIDSEKLNYNRARYSAFIPYS